MKRILVLLLTVTLLFTGCAGMPSSGKEENPLPGVYTVPEGWVKSEQFSTEDKIFYVEAGCEKEQVTDNISVNVGTNRYSPEEHMDFRDAILRQLLTQTKDLDAQLIGEGTYTEQDYVVYIFTITESDVVTKQYYIVGDHRYCLIHLTSFSGSENGYDAAQAIADSFVWDDEEE